MATKAKSTAKSDTQKTQRKVTLPADEQYKQEMLARRNALRKLQGIPEHK